MKVNPRHRRPKGKMTEKQIREWFARNNNEAMQRAASRDIQKAWIEYCVRLQHIPKISRTMIDPDFFAYSDYCKFRGWLEDDLDVDTSEMEDEDA